MSLDIMYIINILKYLSVVHHGWVEQVDVICTYFIIFGSNEGTNCKDLNILWKKHDTS